MKINKQRTIISDSQDKPYVWGDIVKLLEVKNILLLNDDLIDISYVEPFYSENLSWDAHYKFEVTRLELETDEEYKKRLEREENNKIASRNMRYDNYLKLKKEFENEEN